MNNKDLAKKIVEVVNEETSNFDAIDRVEEILNTIIKINESNDIESSSEGIWVAYVGKSSDFMQIGISNTERGAYIELTKYLGINYEAGFLKYLRDNDDATEEDYQLSLCYYGAGKVEYIS